MNNRKIVIENQQKNFQLQLQQNRVINYNFVNYNYNFSKPGTESYYRRQVGTAEPVLLVPVSLQAYPTDTNRQTNKSWYLVYLIVTRDTELV